MSCYTLLAEKTTSMTTVLMVSDERALEHLGPMLGSSLICLPQMTHVELKVHQSNHWIAPIKSSRTSREKHVPDSSNHSLFLTKLFNSSYPEGNFGAPARCFNLSFARLDGSLGLPPLQEKRTMRTSVSQRASTRVFS